MWSNIFEHLILDRTLSENYINHLWVVFIMFMVCLIYFEYGQRRMFNDKWDDIIVVMSKAEVPLYELSDNTSYRHRLWLFYGIFGFNFLAIVKYIVYFWALFYLVTDWMFIYVIAIISPIAAIVLDKIYYIKLAKTFGKDNKFIIKYILTPAKMLQCIANDKSDYNPKRK